MSEAQQNPQGASQKPQGAPSEPPEIAQIISKALLGVTKAKSLQLRLVKLMNRYANANKDSIIVALEYYKELNEIVAEARELRAELQAYLMYLVSKAPLNREDFLRAFTAILNVDFDKPETLITTILSDTFINTYINLILSVQTVGTTPSQHIVFQIPVQPLQGGKP